MLLGTIGTSLLANSLAGKAQLELVKARLEEVKAHLEQERIFNAASSFKVGLSPSKKICVICLIEIPLKMMKNAFYFILKALFVLKLFKFLSRLFGHVGKTA